jgi:hypothetical protein
MKKTIIAATLMMSLGAQANCYWDYANFNLEKKIINGMATLGIKYGALSSRSIRP